MEKTLIELFAGVGGFRCGLNNIRTVEDAQRPEEWQTVWYNQWEPDTRAQWAHDCYKNKFGICLDINGNDTTNTNITEVDKFTIRPANLLVGGFPCQNYSVASTLATSLGIEGEKGVLWWDIRDLLEANHTPFVLLENVDRLLKSPATQRGRDFGIILTCLRDLGYNVEWRVINAAEYGLQQRRRRTYIFAYKNTTAYSTRIKQAVAYDENNEVEERRNSVVEILNTHGFFARTFPIEPVSIQKIKMDTIQMLPQNIGAVSTDFKYPFENGGILLDGVIYTAKTKPSEEMNYEPIPLGEILETGSVDEEYFIPENELYFTSDHELNHTDETRRRLPITTRHTWQYLKGAKKLPRTAKNGHEYIYSEGPIPMIDESNLPARTMLTSEGLFNRSTHIVRDRITGRIRLLTPIETERIQGFPDNWTRDCSVGDDIVQMPASKRRFCMGNALVVDLIRIMEHELSLIFENE